MSATSLRALTWNVDGLNETRLGQRMEQLCLEMLIGGDLRAAIEGRPTPPMPDVIALQEVVRVAHRGYFAPHLRQAGFTIWPQDPPGESEYYELIAVGPRWSIERCELLPFELSPLRRACTLAELRHAQTGARVTMLTAHLESLRSGRDARLAQARQIDAAMRALDGPAFFLGDTNLRSDEWRALKAELSLRDAFEELGSPAAARATWRSESGAAFRFDRVWLAGSITPQRMRLRTARAGSDHAGVEVELSLR